MKRYRVSLTIEGEDRFVNLISLLSREKGYMDGLEVTELARTATNGTPKRRSGSSPTPEERMKWAMGYWPVVKEAMGEKTLHLKQIGMIVERATNKLKASSISPLLSELTEAGKVTRTGRGTYRVS